MAENPLTTDLIALTEKKMDMTLDDIIKMSKKTSYGKRRPPRAPIKPQWVSGNNNSLGQHNSKLRHFMDTRSSIRQGVLAQRRSNFLQNQFSLTTEFAKKALILPLGPIRNRVVNWKKPRFSGAPTPKQAAEGSLSGKDNTVPSKRPQTLDALFSSMKQQRMKEMRRNGRWIAQGPQGRKQQQQQQQHQQRQGGGASRFNTAHQFGQVAR